MTGVEYIKEKYATAGYGMTWYGTGYRLSICINKDTVRMKQQQKRGRLEQNTLVGIY